MTTRAEQAIFDLRLRNAPLPFKAMATGLLLALAAGYVYALAESTDDETQIANAWTSQSAVDQSRRRAERHAFEGLLSELERSWKTVAESYATRPASPPPSSLASSCRKPKSRRSPTIRLRPPSTTRSAP